MTRKKPATTDCMASITASRDPKIHVGTPQEALRIVARRRPLERSARGPMMPDSQSRPSHFYMGTLQMSKVSTLDKRKRWRAHSGKRHGTLSILAGVDLHNGEVFAEVHPRHRSREFILLHKALDEHYPKPCTIRVILDNHSAHISKETMAYLASRPNRFIYVTSPNTVRG